MLCTWTARAIKHSSTILLFTVHRSCGLKTYDAFTSWQYADKQYKGLNDINYTYTVYI